MRQVFLRKVELQITKEWRTTAGKALARVQNLSPAERSAEINRLSDVWASLKPILADASNEKCWYCESLQTRSDRAVDHFRPKNRVTGSRGGEGYWWLAFDWRNYRYSCTYCNSRRVEDLSSGGKQDNFPIAVDAQRGIFDTKPTDLDRAERPQLLDPTKWQDVNLLTFDIGDGSAIPSASEATHPMEHERARVSIELYHLHEEGLRVARLQRMLRIRDLVNTAEKLAEGDPIWDDCVNEIAGSVQPEAEYSAAVRTMLMGLRGSSELACRILEKP